MELVIIFLWALGLVLLANLALRNSTWGTLLIVALLLSSAAAGAMGLIFLLLHEIPLPGGTLAPPPASVGWLLLTVAVLTCGTLVPPFRRWLGRLFPGGLESPVQLTALHLSLYVVVWSLMNLYWIGGVEGLQESAENVPISLYVLQALMLIVFALLGVGAWLRRPWREVVERLGLGRVRRRTVLIVPAAVLALLTTELVIVGLWTLLAPDQVEAIQQVTDVMLGSFDSFGAILLLAILSGLSEEVLFRGAMQPTMGLVFTSIVFASTHIQYAISPATLLVLVIGIVLGVLRRYVDTWTAILTHFGYNFTLLFLGWVASKVLELGL